MARATRGLAGRLRHGLTIPMRGGMNRGRVVTELLVFFFEFDHPQFPIYSEVVKCFQVPDLLMKFGLGCFELYHQAFRASFFFRKASSASFLSVMLQCAITRRRFWFSGARRADPPQRTRHQPTRLEYKLKHHDCENVIARFS